MDISSIDNTAKHVATKSATNNTQPETTKALLDKIQVTGQTTDVAKSLTKKAPPPIQEVQKAADKLNQIAKLHNMVYEFSVVNKGNKVVIVVKDTIDNKVIKEMPSQQAIDISNANDPKKGILINISV